MKSSDLRNLIKECLTEVKIEEGTGGGFLAGGIAGFITSWAFHHRPKGSVQKDKDKVAIAAAEYQDSLVNLKSALEPFAGTTTEQKYEDFLKQVSHTSFDHLKNIKRVRRKE